jgi:hypothetical protein
MEPLVAAAKAERLKHATYDAECARTQVSFTFAACACFFSFLLIPSHSFSCWLVACVPFHQSTTISSRSMRALAPFSSRVAVCLQHYATLNLLHVCASEACLE